MYVFLINSASNLIDNSLVHYKQTSAKQWKTIAPSSITALKTILALQYGLDSLYVFTFASKEKFDKNKL